LSPGISFSINASATVDSLRYFEPPPQSNASHKPSGRKYDDTTTIAKIINVALNILFQVQQNKTETDRAAGKNIVKIITMITQLP